jgi:hypothetical protein
MWRTHSCVPCQNAYQDGPVAQVTANPLSYAVSFWPFAEGTAFYPLRRKQLRKRHRVIPERLH